MSVPTLTRRGYVLDGTLLPRVSTILQTLAKPSLQAWKDRVGLEEAAKVSKAATSLGSAIHAATEAWDRDAELPADDTLRPYIDAYRTWRAQHVADVVSIERVVWPERLRVAGTLDRLYRLRDNRLVLADVKSGRTVDGTARLQTAGYAGMLREVDGTSIDGRIIIHLPSSAPGTIRILEYDNYEHDWLIFRALCAVYWWHDAHKDDWRASNGVWSGAQYPGDATNIPGRDTEDGSPDAFRV